MSIDSIRDLSWKKGLYRNPISLLNFQTKCPALTTPFNLPVTPSTLRGKKRGKKRKMFEIHSHFVKKLVLITYQAQLLNLDKKLPSTPIKAQMKISAKQTSGVVCVWVPIDGLIKSYWVRLCVGWREVRALWTQIQCINAYWKHGRLTVVISNVIPLVSVSRKTLYKLFSSLLLTGTSSAPLSALNKDGIQIFPWMCHNFILKSHWVRNCSM